MTAAAISAFVLVNTVVLVRSYFGAGDTSVAYALAAYGAGSMIAALALPQLLDRLDDRRVMIAAAVLLSVLTLVHAAYFMVVGLLGWTAFLGVWAVSGLLYSAILTPSGRLLRKSAHAEDRPALFAAQFALSHACWLLTYLIAGWGGHAIGLPGAMAVLGALALASVAVALRVWPADDPIKITHAHPDLPPDHPHLQDHALAEARHQHDFVIDDEHRVWPTHG
jgi:MFS family permease